MRYKKVRFHKASGPDSLFRRVHQKMDGHRRLTLPSRQLQKRWTERGIPVGELRVFHSDDWELMRADVRADRGKFVCSSWRRPAGREWLWIEIGMGDHLEKARFKQGLGAGADNIIVEGELYAFVEDVNQELVDAEPWADMAREMDWQEEE